MTHLHRYLAEHGVLYPEQLAEALRRQQIYGGSLDTVLLELDLVDPVTLGELLERACGFPIAPPDLLDNGLDRPWDLIPEELQRSHWVEPLVADGEEIVVAVHPDLPNDMLGGLLRSVRRMRPMVTPECCLEKIVAERHGSVVPQRYAVLCASYLSAVRRRPSISGIYDVPHPGAAPTPTTTAPEPAEPPTPAPTFRPPPRRELDLEATQPMDRRAVAGSIDAREPAPVDAPAGAPPDQRPPGRSTLVASGPPVTPHGTLVSTGAPGPRPPLDSGPPIHAAVASPEPRPPDRDAALAESPVPPVLPPRAQPLVPDRADVDRRLQPARRALRDSRSRDAALEAIVAAATVLTTRAGLFRVRGAELVGLSNPTSALDDLGGKIVSAAEGTAAGTAIAVGRFVGRATEADLRLATGTSPETPCALQTVEVRGRPVVVMYIDRDGAPLHETDPVHLAELAELSGAVFEEILKLRRGSARRTGPVPPPDPDPDAGRAGPEPSKGWGIVPPRVRATYGDGDPGGEPAPVEPISSSRTSTPDREHGPALPPSPVPATTAPLPPGDWRLTPELATIALQARADADDGPEPPATLQDEELPTRPPRTPPPPADDETSFAGVSDDHASASSDPKATASAFEIEPPATLEDEELPSPPSAEDITEVGLSRPSVPPPAEPPSEPEVEPPPSATNDGLSPDRPTMQISRLGSGPIEAAPAPRSAPGTADEPDDDVDLPSTTSHPTVVADPPPPPLPPPPPSAVDLDDPDDRGRRSRRGSTISGLPPPELRGRESAIKRKGPPPSELLPSGDEEVEIISLARPITPATARGRIELEEEDWMPTGAPLASDAQQAEIDALIERVVTGEADVDELREHGNAGLLRLLAQFPGPLEVMRRDLRSLPPPSAHGPLIRTIIGLGPIVVPHLVDLFEHPNPDVRFYAAFLFHELRDTRCMRPLAKLAFDTNGDVRVVSMRVLETYRRSEGFDVAASLVREQLGSETRAQQLHAARAAGTLRDIGAIPQLITLLTAGDRFIQEASLESLCSITGQQHGLKPHRWRSWYEEQGHLHRVEWIIDSLRHRDLPVRRWAADELVRITGQRVPFSPMGDRRAREIAVNAWTDWWNTRGRDIFDAS